MRYWIALCLLSFSSFGMELTIQSGKEDSKPYSILHLRHSSPFSCSAFKDEFGEEKSIECLFPKNAKQNFNPIDNAHLLIRSASTSKGYVITVTPKSKMKLIPISFDLPTQSETYQRNVQNAKHWIVVGYPDKLPLITPVSPSSSAINFPIKIDKNINPYVGGLDLKGNPIKISRVQDVTDYMEMKKAYAAKNYDKVLELADNSLKYYPKTVFKNELMLYQIRALHKKEDSEKLLDVTKQFLRDYSADPNVAEVLAYTANAYSKIGQSIDADYFFDRLFDEQSDSPFASLGMVYKAEQFEASGDPKKAMQFYQKALSTTNDVETASKAAFKLAQMELDSANTKKAGQYIDKIASANPGYFSYVRNDSMGMIETLTDRNDTKSAAKITEALLKKTDVKTPDHELLLKNLGMELAQAGKRDDALKRFNEYLGMYKYGEYVEEVRRAKDGLFFETGDTNATAGIKKYNDLIERYGDDSVGRKALYKKAQLLLKEKKYKEVLELEDQLYRLDSVDFPDTGGIITKSAIGLEKEYLKEGKCGEAMGIQKMYRIKLLPEWDKLTYECALKTAQYPLAKKIAQAHLKSKSLADRQIWLSRMVKTQFGLGEYKDAIKGGEELITLLNVEKNPPLNDIYRTMFDTAQRLGDAEAMVRHIKSVESAFPNDFKDVERYTQMVSLGLRLKDETLVQNYGQKVMALQSRTKTYTQTPYIEFTLVQSYQNVGKDSQALEVLKTLNNRKLGGEKRARQQYLMGAIYQKSGKKKEAKAAFNASMKADPASAWGKLAKDALPLL